MVLFPKDKILTVIASEYCISVGKDLRDYDLVGIHIDDDIDFASKLINKFQQIVPKGAEVVVDFRYAVGGAGRERQWALMQYASGTALIPKKG